MISHTDTGYLEVAKTGLQLSSRAYAEMRRNFPDMAEVGLTAQYDCRHLSGRSKTSVIGKAGAPWPLHVI